jgi:hypothetical protein
MVSHRGARAFLLACVLAPGLVQAAGFAGVYAGEIAGQRSYASLQTSDDRLVGSLDVGAKARINLTGRVREGMASGSANSKDGTGAFEAQVEGDTLVLTLSQPEGPKQKAMRVTSRLQRVVAGGGARPGGDPRLAGHWSYQNLIVSGNASFASEEHLLFRADGTYVYGKGATAAGATDWSFDGGSGGEREDGLWRAQEGMLFVVGREGQWMRVGTYAMTEDGRAMRITYDGGGRKLWTRRSPAAGR